jgi:hypothetical protein
VLKLLVKAILMSVILKAQVSLVEKTSKNAMIVPVGKEPLIR